MNRILRYMAPALLAPFFTAAFAATDYSSLEGLQGAALKQAVKTLALPHTAISYGDKTWEAFAVADVREIQGRDAWFDMYSNRLVYVESGHSGMNIEHAVANSWWGGVKNDAYKDLHHLNPSDADANNRKNNNPLAEVQAVTWSNGLTTIGEPAAGLGGGATSAFEPAPQFRGDFARAYFYIFTLYDNICWEETPAYMYELSAYPTLRPWAYEMLLRWAEEDPVDQREASRNAAVAGIQKNENPFVSIPGLAEYIWGSKKNTPFSLRDAMTQPVANRPSAPSFGSQWQLAGVDTYTGRWWTPQPITLSSDPGAEIYYTLTSGNEFQLYQGPFTIGQAAASGQTLEIRAYAQTTLNGRPYRGAVSTLTLTASDPEVTDYMHATWEKVTALSEISESELYVVVASKAGEPMACESTSTSSSAYLKSLSTNVVDASGKITSLPEGAGVVNLIPAGGGEYYLQVSDLSLNPKGYISTDAAKKAYLRQEGAPATIGLTPSKNAKIDFGTTYGTLQYNAQSPRFSIYTSSQQAVDLYRCVSNPQQSTVLEPQMQKENETEIFTLDGRKLPLSDTSRLPQGIYILKTPSKTTKIMKK